MRGNLFVTMYSKFYIDHAIILRFSLKYRAWLYTALTFFFRHALL